MAKRFLYFEDSPVAAVVRKLPKGLSGQPIPRRKTPKKPLGNPQVWLADYVKDARSLNGLLHSNRAVRVVYLTGKSKLPKSNHGAFAFLPGDVTPAAVGTTLESALATAKLADRATAARVQLKQTIKEIQELNRIGVALSSEKDPEKLLELILRKSREITSSDAGSLYLVEEVGDGEKRLRFKLTQNDSIQTYFSEFTVPLNRDSIAGYVADTGEVLHLHDAYEIPKRAPYHFNRNFDEETGYRTKSVLTIPLKTPKGEVLGVLQLLNCKRVFSRRLDSPEAFRREVIPYQEHQIAMATSLASQAAVAYDNNVLYENIQTLFEGFVKAAVTAIEQRDPTTSGHSFRVSQLTCGLAETADKIVTGPYKNLSFTREQMKEIRYAALLHDFGKVGVREEVLVKAKKLYPDQLRIVQHRFDYVRKEIEADVLRRKLRAVQERQPAEVLTRLEEELRARLGELDDYLQFILTSNEPTVLPEGNFQRLLDIARQSYRDPRGIERPLLTPEEVRFLSIPKGSLDPDERVQIESHVLHTFNFLTQIPWTRDLKGVPAIARGHHEKLNGRGYPYNLSAREISPQTRMMTISDMFDALSAADRPYKKAVPIERALEILAHCVKEGELDPILYQLFVDAKIYQLTAKK